MTSQDGFPTDPLIVGTILTYSLEEEAKYAKSTGRDPREVALVDAAGLTWGNYENERFYLYASAFAFSIEQFFGNTVRAQRLDEGFHSVWKRAAAASSGQQQMYEQFEARRRLYILAARADSAQLQGIDPDATYFYKTDYLFGDYLIQKSSMGTNSESPCRMLAMALGQAFWRSHIASAKTVFTRAGFLQ